MSWGEVVRSRHGEPAGSREAAPPRAFVDAASSARPKTQAEPSDPSPARPADQQVANADIARLDRRIDRLGDEVGTSADASRDRLEALGAEIKPRLDGIESELESSISVLSEQVGRIDDKLAVAEGRIAAEVAALRETVDALQRTVELAFDRLDQGGEPGGLTGKAEPTPRAADQGAGIIALNSAGFEDFRALGLSVTQVARVIAFRDTRGGFSDLGQLDDVRGLSAEDRAMLRSRTTI